MRKTLSVLFVVSFLFATTAPAYAYLDGGTGSVLLQTLFAGVAGITAIMRLYWYKVKLIVAKIMGKAEALEAEKEDC